MWRAFWFHMHLVAKNLAEFTEDLSKIDDNIYAYHVKGHDNALARWVQEVIGDAVLAEALRDAPDLAAARRVAEMRLKELQAAAKIPTLPIANKLIF